MSVFFWLLLAFSFILALTIAVLHSSTFLAWSNYAQIFTAAACAATCAYAFRFKSKDMLLLLASFAFGGWALSNVFWYSYVAILGPSLMYPTISESGFLGFMLFLAAGYQIAFPRAEGSGLFPLAAAMPFLAVPIAVVYRVGLTPATAVTSLYFVIEAYLVWICVRHGLQTRPLLLAGTIGYCLTMCVYALRETVFLEFTILYLAGPMAIASFCLIQLGLLTRLEGDLK